MLLAPAFDYHDVDHHEEAKVVQLKKLKETCKSELGCPVTSPGNPMTSSKQFRKKNTLVIEATATQAICHSQLNVLLIDPRPADQPWGK